ncbi:hypothetical protein [Corynebacterium nuruki]|uniref:hypothetical protein n=1 Tax=Corynebacterium nuruki TaxID=1032851 RepID=UPI0039BF1A10
MHHYDLYSALGLDRSASCADLAAQLDQRSAAGAGSQATELWAARAVLGSPERRALYDRQLADPTAPAITLQDITELAEMDVDGPGDTRIQPAAAACPAGTAGTAGTAGSPGSAAWSAGPAAWSVAAAAPAPAPAPGPTDGPGNTTRNILIGAGAVVVVAAVVIAGILLTRDRGDDTEDGSPTFGPEVSTGEATPENSPAPSAGQSPAPESAPADPGTSQDSALTPLGDITPYGWTAVPAAMCNNRPVDKWVYAAGNRGGDRIVVCQVGDHGDYYYRALVNGKGGDIDWNIDMSTHTDTYFRTESKGGRYIVIDGDHLNVYSDNANGPVSRTDFDWSHSDLETPYFGR